MRAMRFERYLSTDETLNFCHDLKNEEKRNLFANLRTFPIEMQLYFSAWESGFQLQK